MFFFNLRNDPSVIEACFNSSPVSFHSHLGWFMRKLRDPKTELKIIEENGKPIGQIRFDMLESGAEISIDIIEACRGKGVGSRSIAEASGVFFREHPEVNTIAAFIKLENTPSQRTFAKAGFSNPDVCPGHPDRVQMMYQRSS